MDFAAPSTFRGEARVSEKGTYEIIIYAYDPQTGNTGVDKVTVEVD
jgi:chitodextrinase